MDRLRREDLSESGLRLLGTAYEKGQGKAAFTFCLLALSVTGKFVYVWHSSAGERACFFGIPM